MIYGIRASAAEPSAVPPLTAGSAAPDITCTCIRRSRIRVSAWVLLILALTVSAGAVLLLRWIEPKPLHFRTATVLPRPVLSPEGVKLTTPGYILVAELTSYDDELFAYLMFDYLSRRPEFGGSRVLLSFDSKREEKPYSIVLRGQWDLQGAIRDVASLHYPVDGTTLVSGLRPISDVRRLEEQTRLFVSAYNLPVRRKLEELPPRAVSAYLQRFIQFKSATDPRVRLRLEPPPRPLSPGEAQHLAGDIITIAEFFSIPLEVFLGIGAMENNYMNVRGDLEHTIWKRRAAPDDIVIERRRRGVRVVNDSAGVWQITRETLRYAHSLVEKDARDYSSLPDHLRPPARLKVADVTAQVLTTYAGVLLRDLLDQFNGDWMLAVSAYNGGPARPNLRYGEGVRNAARHARSVLEQAAALNGQSVVKMEWLRR